MNADSHEYDTMTGFDGNTQAHATSFIRFSSDASHEFVAASFGLAALGHLLRRRRQLWRHWCLLATGETAGSRAWLPCPLVGG
jgi:MYXO-CTERM domain-containing protein